MAQLDDVHSVLRLNHDSERADSIASPSVAKPTLSGTTSQKGLLAAKTACAKTSRRYAANICTVGSPWARLKD
jgi:hypothetical protein